jgi:hypothetical protein
MPGGTFGLVGDYGCSDSEEESGEDDPAAPQTTASNSVNSTEDGDDEGKSSKRKVAIRITQLIDSIAYFALVHFCFIYFYFL